MCTVVLHWSIQKIVQKGRSREALLVRYHSHGVSSHQRLGKWLRHTVAILITVPSGLYNPDLDPIWHYQMDEAVSVSTIPHMILTFSGWHSTVMHCHCKNLIK